MWIKAALQRFYESADSHDDVNGQRFLVCQSVCYLSVVGDSSGIKGLTKELSLLTC